MKDNKISKANASEYGRRGGIASGEARRRKRDMKETMDIIMALPLDDKKAVELANLKSFKNVFKSNPDVQTAMLAALAKRAMSGNVLACELVMNILGENPALKVEADVDTELHIKMDYGDQTSVEQVL